MSSLKKTTTPSLTNQPNPTERLSRLERALDNAALDLAALAIVLEHVADVGADGGVPAVELVPFIGTLKDISTSARMVINKHRA